MNFDDFKNELSGTPPEKIVFVALGNRYREDDCGGIIFSEALAERQLYRESTFINADINPENYLQEIIRINPSAIVFIDAADKNSGISWLEGDSIENCDFSTHTYSIRLIEKYILLNLNTSIRYLGIGGKKRMEIKKITEHFFSGSKGCNV